MENACCICYFSGLFLTNSFRCWRSLTIKLAVSGILRKPMIQKQNVHNSYLMWGWRGGGNKRSLSEPLRVLTLVLNGFFSGWVCMVATEQINVYVYCICVSYGCVREPGKITSTSEGVGRCDHFWISGGLWFFFCLASRYGPWTQRPKCTEAAGLWPLYKQHIHHFMRVLSLALIDISINKPNGDGFCVRSSCPLMRDDVLVYFGTVKYSVNSCDRSALVKI